MQLRLHAYTQITHYTHRGRFVRDRESESERQSEICCEMEFEAFQN